MTASGGTRGVEVCVFASVAYGSWETPPELSCLLLPQQLAAIAHSPLHLPGFPGYGDSTEPLTAMHMTYEGGRTLCVARY